MPSQPLSRNRCGRHAGGEEVPANAVLAGCGDGCHHMRQQGRPEGPMSLPAGCLAWGLGGTHSQTGLLQILMGRLCLLQGQTKAGQRPGLSASHLRLGENQGPSLERQEVLPKVQNGKAFPFLHWSLLRTRLCPLKSESLCLKMCLTVETGPLQRQSRWNKAFRVALSLLDWRPHKEARKQVRGAKRTQGWLCGEASGEASPAHTRVSKSSLQ